MGVETKAGVYIPTETECQSALGQLPASTSNWYCYEMEGAILCNGCLESIPVSQWSKHTYNCPPFAKYLRAVVRPSS